MEEIKERQKPGPKPKQPAAESKSTKYEKWSVEFKGKEFTRVKRISTHYLDEWVVAELNAHTSPLNRYHYYSAL